MKGYERPVVLVNEDLAEGVYAASGAVSDSGSVSESSSGSGSVGVSNIELSSAGNEYYKVNTYKVTIANTGNAESADWTAEVSVTSGTATSAQIYDGWQAKASLNGSTITITPGGGGAIGAGQSIEVEIVVGYSSNSVTVE